MGGALVEGLIASPQFNNSDIMVSDPVKTVRKKIAAKGVSVTDNNREAAAWADVVMVVVKPWLVEQVMREIAPALSAENVLVVIAAGVPSAKILEWTAVEGMPLFLCIPNIAIAQLASMTFLVPAAQTTAKQTEAIKGIFEAMGQVLITDEQHLGQALPSPHVA